MEPQEEAAQRPPQGQVLVQVHVQVPVQVAVRLSRMVGGIAGMHAGKKVAIVIGVAKETHAAVSVGPVTLKNAAKQSLSVDMVAIIA